MDLADLRALLQVVEYGSFQRAALALRGSRSGLRRQVERLENELDVALLSRGAQGIELTAAGQEIADGAARLLRDAANLAERAWTFRADARGTLRFVVPMGLPNEGRVRALVGLRTLHPELDIEVIEAEDPLTTLNEPFDMMIHFGHAPNREGWFSHVIMRIPTQLWASPAYLDEHGTPASLDELDDHALVQWSAPGLDVRGLPLRSGGTVALSPWLRSANIALLFDIAKAGAGIAYAPVPPAQFERTTDLLVPVLEDVVGTEVDVRALSPRPSRTDPKIRAVLENIQRLLGTLDEASSPSPA